MNNIKIKANYDYEKLVNFFIENGLEFDAEEIVSTDLIKSFSAFLDMELIGSVVLAKREGRYIIDGIASKKKVRNMGLGELLLCLAEEEARKVNADKTGENTEVYLVARAPKFFEKMGYKEIDRGAAPTFFECFSCSQYDKTCFPKVMKRKVKKNEFCGHNCEAEK
jgi:N-acetylglutamate synthase-like GNAT family acetyltransferase